MFATPDLYAWVAWALAGLALVLGIQMLGVPGLFAAIVAALLVLTAVAYVMGRRARRALSRHDPRFRPTEEFFLDHATGKVMRVHVDADTGERRYWKDA